MCKIMAMQASASDVSALPQQERPFQSPGGALDMPKPETATELCPGSSLVAGATTATVGGKYTLTDLVKSKKGHPQKLGGPPQRRKSMPDLSSESESELTNGRKGLEKFNVVKLEQKHPFKYMDRKRSKSLSDISSGSDSEDHHSLFPCRRSNRQKRKLSLAGAIMQSSASFLALRGGIDKDNLQIWKSSEMRVTISKERLTKSTSASNSWDCKILLEVFKKEKGNVTAQFYLHPNTGDQDSTAELRVHAKVSKSLFKKIKDHFKKCWIIVESEVLDHQAGKELGFRDHCPQWIDPTKDGTVNFNHKLVLCEPLSKSGSQNVDIVIKVIFVTHKPDNVEEYEGDFLYVKTV